LDFLMSEQPQNERGPGRALLIVAGVVGVALIGLLLYQVTATSPTRTTTPTDGGGLDGDSLESTVAALSKDPTLGPCSRSLQQINSHLAAVPDRKPPVLDAGSRDALRTYFDLKPDEIEEIEAPTFTLLDPHYLNFCLLLRDAARSLQVDEAVPQTPLDRATVAFEWVMRQVRLGDRTEDVFQEVLPPSFVLRRGWGSQDLAGLDRALIFLALLEQCGRSEKDRSDLRGCLIYCPDAAGTQRLWACGVLVEGSSDLHLFDPRLGLPVPGPDGKGVATLAAVRKGPALLAQLDSGEHKYDVTGEQANAAEVHQVCALSALAPRMAELQKLLSPTIRVHLSVDALADQKALRQAAEAAQAAGGKPVPVRAWRADADHNGPGLLRRFLPPADGGVDPGLDWGGQKIQKQERFKLSLVPLGALPEQLLRDFPPYIGQRVQLIFADPFVRAFNDPKQPRELLLRGQFGQAIPLLQGDRGELEMSHTRFVSADKRTLAVEVNEWLTQVAIPAYAEQLRAHGDAQARESADRKVEVAWRKADALSVLLQGAIARRRRLEVSAQLALCTHEQAEHLQVRLDLQARTQGAPRKEAEVRAATDAWRDAENWWTKCLKYAAEDTPKDAPKEVRNAPLIAARTLLARAKGVRGERAEATRLLEDLSGGMTPLEKIANLYRARQVKK
jgi:hypothetical protein